MVRCLPTKIIEEELNRRNVAAVTVLNQLIEVIYSVSKDMSLQDMEKLIKDVKNISKCKKKVIIEETQEEVKEEQNVQE